METEELTHRSAKKRRSSSVGIKVTREVHHKGTLRRLMSVQLTKQITRKGKEKISYQRSMKTRSHEDDKKFGSP